MVWFIYEAKNQLFLLDDLFSESISITKSIEVELFALTDYDKAYLYTVKNNGLQIIILDLL